MSRMILRDDQWTRIEPLLSGKASDCGVTGKNNRLFIEAVLWICPTGAPWRDLLSEFGHWHTVYMRYNRWSKKGHWQRILKALGAEPDLKYLMVDGSITRVHQHGAPKKQPRGRSHWQILGRLEHENSRGSGCAGQPYSPDAYGQASQYSQAERLIQGFDADYVLAHRGYDSDQFIEVLQAMEAVALIPPQGNRRQQRDYDQQIYKEQNLVERLFQKLKQFRRIATRYERLKRNYQSMLNLACSMIWLT